MIKRLGIVLIICLGIFVVSSNPTAFAQSVIIDDEVNSQLKLESQLEPATTLCDAASFVSDVTIPDNTQMTPGQSFVKTWRLKNNGTCTWKSGYKLVFTSGEDLASSHEVAINGETKPGATVDISVSMKAPTTKGSFSSYWMLKNAAGKQFGMGNKANIPVWVKIKVTSSPVTQTPNAKTQTPVPSGCDVVSYVSDVSVPDGTSFAPGQSFIKTWRLKNSGTCAWDKGYRFVFSSGVQMGASSEYPLPKIIAPGETVDVSIEMIAPTTNGTYTGYWRLRNGGGQTFGIGANGKGAVWVKIRVDKDLPTPIPSPSPTINPALAYCDWASFVKDVTVPDMSLFLGGREFTKTWRIKNIGKCSWTTNYKFVYDSGNDFRAAKSINLPKAVAPGETIDISVKMISPFTADTYIGYWKLQNEKGERFGIGQKANGVLYVKIEVRNTIRESFMLHEEMCNATWQSGASNKLRCPAKEPNLSDGSVYFNTGPQIEGGGWRREQMTIITIPNDGKDGYIKGVFPEYFVQEGDRFTTTIGCLFDSDNCEVTFEFGYLDVDGKYSILYGPEVQRYDNVNTKVEVPLSKLYGKDVQFVMSVKNNGSSDMDYAYWLYPTIWRDKR